MEEIGEEMDVAVAREVFGVTQAVIDAWPWTIPEFSTDRCWAAAVVQKIMFSGNGLRLNELLQDAIPRLGSEADMKKYGSLNLMLTVLTPDEICVAALTMVREDGT